MRSVKLAKDALLQIVRENKEKHVSDFTEAVADYKRAVASLCQKNHELAQTGELSKLEQIRAMPMLPVSYEDNYSRAIRMLELSVDDVIELEDQIFNQLVLDEWSWKRGFTASAALYKTML
jgi:hypothetical protein